MDARLPIRKTLFWKLTSWYLLISVSLAAVHVTAQHFLLNRATDTLDQFLGWGVATRVSSDLEPLLQKNASFWDLQLAVHRIVEAVPGVSVYLLNHRGGVVAGFAEHENVSRPVISLDAVHRFIDNHSPAILPLYGEDPGSIRETQIFSASPIRLNGEPGYVYVILKNSVKDSASKALLQKALLRTSTFSAALLTLLAVFAGTFVFYLLTRRIRSATITLSRFAHGDYSERLDESTDDELGEQARTVNKLADAVVSQMAGLAHKDELRRELIANVSHDLRGPTTVILGSLEMLASESVKLDESQRALCSAAKRNARSLSTLLDELFELSELEAKESQPQLEAFQICDLLDDLQASLAPLAKERRVHLSAECDEHLPDVQGDISMLSRVLMNFLHNALRYTPENGSVVVGAKTECSKVRVFVRDTGKGIRPDELEQIFDRYFQSKLQAADERGLSGLGLAIAKKIVEAHGSTIHVTSQVDHGTEFSFTLDLDTSKDELLVAP